MTELEFASLLVSRVCHDLVSPLGAVVNGLEVLEEEHDAAMRRDALRLVGTSADQALARLQFLRLAFGAAGSAGAEVDMEEVGKMVMSWFSGSRISLHWEATPPIWPKAWAKLVMNGTMILADCLPRGGEIRFIATPQPEQNGFSLTAAGQGARITEKMAAAVSGTADADGADARGIQPILAHAQAKSLGANLTLTPGADQVSLVARPVSPA